MSTVDYIPIANGAGANVETQAQYLVDAAPGGALQDGYESGIVPSNRFNKTVRQSSMMTAAVANMISTALAIDVLDDGNLGALITNLTNAIAAVAVGAVGPGVPTGVQAAFLGSAAPTGWVLCIGTIGNAASGGTRRANADTASLFSLIWNSFADSEAPVSGGRGASAAADYAANKTITLPDMRGRAVFGLDNLGGVAANRVTSGGSGIVGTTMGASGGSQAVQQHTHVATSTVTDGGHAHNANGGTGQFVTTTVGAGSNAVGGANTQTVSSTDAAPTGITVATSNANFGTGSSANMVPAMMLSVIVKL